MCITPHSSLKILRSNLSYRVLCSNLCIISYGVLCSNLDIILLYRVLCNLSYYHIEYLLVYYDDTQYLLVM